MFKREALCAFHPDHLAVTSRTLFTRMHEALNAEDVEVIAMLQRRLFAHLNFEILDEAGEFLPGAELAVLGVLDVLEAPGWSCGMRERGVDAALAAAGF